MENRRAPHLTGSSCFKRTTTWLLEVFMNYYCLKKGGANQLGVARD